MSDWRSENYMARVEAQPGWQMEIMEPTPTTKVGYDFVTLWQIEAAFVHTFQTWHYCWQPSNEGYLAYLKQVVLNTGGIQYGDTGIL